MPATHWKQIAVLTAALGLTGAAIAQNAEGTTSTQDRASVSSSVVDTPSSGAIVTPEDKALGMGQDNAREGVRNGNDDASVSNGDTLSVNPGPSDDEDSSIDPGRSNDDKLSVDRGHPGTDEAPDSRHGRPR
jgi:hypothetical protein